jgi:hypothetical protein
MESTEKRGRSWKGSVNPIVTLVVQFNQCTPQYFDINQQLF